MTCKRTTIAVIAFAVALVFCGTIAGQSNAAYDHVVKVQANKNKHLAIAVAGNFSSAHGCRTPWWAISQNEFDDPQTQAMLQVALSSLLARAPVHVYTEGCNAEGYPILTQIQIQEREPPPSPSPTPIQGTRCGNNQKCCGFEDPADKTCNGTCILKTKTCVTNPN